VGSNRVEIVVLTVPDAWSVARGHCVRNPRRHIVCCAAERVSAEVRVALGGRSVAVTNQRARHVQGEPAGCGDAGVRVPQVVQA
jgi:hypothetical protein